MSTYAELKARGNATVVTWAEISGIPWSPSDGLISEANKSTLFGDAYTPTLTFSGTLMPIADSFSRSIELHSGRSSVGGFTLELLDAATTAQPDGFWTWAFGTDRSTIMVKNLTANVDPDDLNWTVTPAFGGGVSAQVGYCELETVRYDVAGGTPTIVNVTSRSLYRSPSTWHKGNTYSVFPRFTDHPLEWAGRIVTLFQTYMDADGVLASTDGTTATARAAAHKWRGVLRDVSFQDNVWRVRCDSIDTLLRRPAVRGQPQGIATARARVRKMFVDGVDMGGVVCAVNLEDPAGVVDPHAYYGSVAADSIVTRESLIAALNVAFQQGVIADEDGATNTWEGTLSFSWDTDRLRVVYHTSSVAADVRRCVVNLGVEEPGVEGNLDTFDYWRALGVSDDNAMGNTRWIEDPPTADTSYTFEFLADTAQVDATRARFSVTLAPAEGLDGIAGASSFAVGDAVAIVSDAGVTPALVREVDGANGTLRLGRIVELDPFGVIHPISSTKPVKVKRAFYGYRAQNGQGNAGPGLAEPLLRLLLGTGLPGFNHANYDLDPEGIGVAFPHLSPMAGASSSESLVDIAGILAFFGEAEAYVDYIMDFVHEPTEMLRWMQQRVGFLGGFITVQNGQLTVRRGIGPLFSDARHTLSEDELLPGWQVELGQLATVDGVRYRYNWSLPAREFQTDLLALPGDAVSGKEPQNVVTWEDRGIRTNDARLRALAYSYLYDFGSDNRVYSGAADRVHWNVEPGQCVRFSDEGAGDTTDDTRRYLGLPNPDGTRGFGTGAQAARMLALSVASSPEDGTTRLRLVHVRSRRSGYAPSAWIESFTNVGNAVLTCTANYFRPTADGKDVGAFTVGDKVRVLSINPTQAGADPGLETGEGGLTIQSINETANTITLTGVLSVAWPSPPASGTQCIVLTLDPYQTASQTDTAKSWCHVGDSSGDVGDIGDKCYQW